MRKGQKLSEENKKKISEKLKGRVPWNKGMPRNDETKRKISKTKKGHKMALSTKSALAKANIGRKMSEKHRNIMIERMKGQSNPMYGQTHNEETRRKMSESHMGKKLSPESVAKSVSARIGKYSGSNNYWYGKKHTEETRKKMRETAKNKPRRIRLLSQETKRRMSESRKGRIITEETKIKIRLAHLGKQKHTEESKEKIRQARSKQIVPSKDSKPERMMQIALSLNNIKYEKHKPIKIGKNYVQVDIFIEPNICIFIDGDFYHANPEKYNSETIIWKERVKNEKIKTAIKAKDIWAKDLQIQHKLNIDGYQVIRIWERDIKSNTNSCAENIIRLIQNMKELNKNFV